MIDFSNIIPSGLSAMQLKRYGRREILPTSIKGRQLTQDLLNNSAVENTTFSFNDGVVITVTSRITHSTDKDIRLGAVPFMFLFAESASVGGIIPGTNLIPFDVATGRFDIYGPFAMPDFTYNSKRFLTSTGIYFSTDGNDLVYKTAIRNSSGGARTVTALIQARIIQNRGGGVV